jgi:hypothetical protein
MDEGKNEKRNNNIGKRRRGERGGNIHGKARMYVGVVIERDKEE